MSTETLPPHSEAAEQAVLGALINDAKTAWPIVLEALGSDPDAFYDTRHRTLYESLSRMILAGSPVCSLTAFEQLRLDGQVQNVGGLQYLLTLPDKCPSAHGVGYFAEIVLQLHQKRQLMALGASVSESASQDQSDIDGLIAETIQKTTGISKPRRLAMPSIRDLVIGALDQIEACHQSQGKLPGITTGFVDLDKQTCGLQNGDMIVIAARPSMGKTSLAMNIAEHVAVDCKTPVGVFSLEMTAQSLTTRMLASRASLNLRELQINGKLTDGLMHSINSASGPISSAPLHIDDSVGLTIFELRNRAIKMREDFGIRLLVIDYLQLIRGTGRKNDNRQTEVADISNGIKQIAKELNVPVIALCQLNREMERDKNRRPRLSDLRESGAIEQDADVVGMLWRVGSKEKDGDDDVFAERQEITLTIAKQRNGPTGDVPLIFVKSITRFQSAAHSNYEPE